MEIEELVETGELVKEIEQNFPEDYQKKIDNLVDGKDEDVSKQMLKHLNTLLLNNNLNQRHLFSFEEINYFDFVRAYSREKIKNYKKEEEKLFLKRKKGLSESQKKKYSKGPSENSDNPSDLIITNERPKIMPDRISSKGRKCCFDSTFVVHLSHLTFEQTKFTVRIEGKIVSESNDEFKIKTRNFWGFHYGHNIISYPKSLEARNEFGGYDIRNTYWISKDKVNFI